MARNIKGVSTSKSKRPAAGPYKGMDMRVCSVCYNHTIKEVCSKCSWTMTSDRVPSMFVPDDMPSAMSEEFVDNLLADLDRQAQPVSDTDQAPPFEFCRRCVYRSLTGYCAGCRLDEQNDINGNTILVPTSFVQDNRYRVNRERS